MGLNKILAIRQCANCGKDVEIRHKDRLQREHIFCSKKCEGEYRKKHNPNYYKCEVCGKLVYKKPSQLKKNKHIVCSNECANKLKSQIYKGENNPNYNHIRRKNNDIMYKNNYIYERQIGHPFSDEDGWVRQHRLVAEKYLLTDENSIIIDNVTYLSPNYDVHHIDFNKHNNNPDNLMVLSRSEHSKLHQQLLGHDGIKPKHSTNKTSSKIKKTCPVCHTEFECYSNEDRTCCSVECSNIYRNRAVLDCTCDYCGKSFKIKQSRYNKSSKHFCNRECYTKYRNLKENK